MWFWWFLFVCNLIVPIIMIGAGRMMWKHCPDKINMVYGYRTKYSMINNDTWRFAHWVGMIGRGKRVTLLFAYNIFTLLIIYAI